MMWKIHQEKFRSFECCLSDGWQCRVWQWWFKDVQEEGARLFHTFRSISMLELPKTFRSLIRFSIFDSCPPADVTQNYYRDINTGHRDPSARSIEDHCVDLKPTHDTPMVRTKGAAQANTNSAMRLKEHGVEMNSAWYIYTCSLKSAPP